VSIIRSLDSVYLPMETLCFGNLIVDVIGWRIEYFQLGEINKKINAVQKEITAKKKVCF
jgi:hypothetical protein